MKEIAGVAAGFMLMPCTLGLMAAFVWVFTKFDLSKSSVALGVFIGIATMLVSAGIGFYVALRT